MVLFLFYLLAVSGAGWFDNLFPSEDKEMSNSKNSRVNRINVQSGTVEKDASSGTEIVNYRTLVGLPVREDRIRTYIAAGLLPVTLLIANQAAPQRLQFYDPAGVFANEINESGGEITPNPTYDELALSGPAFYHIKSQVQGHPTDRTKEGNFELSTGVIGAYPAANGQTGDSHKAVFHPNSDTNIIFEAKNNLVAYVPAAGGTLYMEISTLLRPLGGVLTFEVDVISLVVTKISI